MKTLVVIVIDAGADGAEFLNEGQRFADIHGVPPQDVLIYDDDMLTNHEMRQAFYSDCADRVGQSYDLFAYFGHGGNRGSKYPGGWIQLHFNQNPNSDGHVSNFAAALSDILSPNAVLMFYGCLVAAGPDPGQKVWSNNDPAWVNAGSFTQALSQELCEAGILGNIVIGRSTSGHTTENAMVLVTTDCGNAAGWHVIPYSGAEWDAWSAALHDPYDELRYRFPVEYIGYSPQAPAYPGYDLETTSIVLVGGWLVALGAAAWYLLKPR